MQTCKTDMNEEVHMRMGAKVVLSEKIKNSDV